MPEDPSAIQLWRIYTRDDGTSAMQQIDLPLDASRARGGVSKMLAGEGFHFRWMPADLNADWHPAPRRQMVATISGEGEVETGDGQVLVVKPGVVTYLEDTKGKGHKTRARGGAGRMSIFLPLDDNTSIP
jgi:mannose-6-phosphate isomerase-like protein (cupin superfamily)